MKIIDAFTEISEGIILPSDKIIEGAHGKNQKGYVVEHGLPFVHRDTENLNAIIARERGARGKPGQKPSKKQLRKLEANQY
jgi:hypothetical protein